LSNSNDFLLNYLFALVSFLSFKPIYFHEQYVLKIISILHEVSINFLK